jgi:hypothetical protein
MTIAALAAGSPRGTGLDAGHLRAGGAVGAVQSDGSGHVVWTAEGNNV